MAIKDKLMRPAGKTKLFVLVWTLKFGFLLTMPAAPADYFIYKY
jgi:hypothetical protein